VHTLHTLHTFEDEQDEQSEVKLSNNIMKACKESRKPTLHTFE
jgi:hypothetical protein